MSICNAEFKKLNDDNDLAEISQQLEGKFSFATIKDNVVYRIHEWVKCRDFLGDIVWNNKYNKPTNIYGFEANETRKIDTDKTRLVFKVKPETIDLVLKQYEQIIHPIEKINGFELTTIYPLLKKPGVILIEGDKRWQQTLWTISLYTYLFKLCVFPWKNALEWQKEITKIKHCNEKTYFETTKEYFSHVVNNINKFINDGVTGYKNEDKLGIDTIHNSCGFVSIIKQIKWEKVTNTYSKNMALKVE